MTDWSYWHSSGSIEWKNVVKNYERVVLRQVKVVCAKCSSHRRDCKNRDRCAARVQASIDHISGKPMLLELPECVAVNRYGNCPDYKPKRRR
ncbi:MAG TPA: hypothetical protein VMY37_10025 [Thermoguttaceae bacterium]|nr:hypothetical protein [Thermoguttaceae bacterium]